MLLFSPCKINIGLNIINKRADGFHNLQSVFYPVPLHDVLEIIINKETDANPIEFTCSGLEINGNSEDNIILKAVHLITNSFQNHLLLTQECYKLMNYHHFYSSS